MYFEIQVDDIERAKQFYSKVFGWQFINQPGPIEYWQIQTPTGIHGGLMQRPLPAPESDKGANAFVCSVQVDSFDKTAESIVANGGNVSVEKFAIPGRCWQGYFTDTEGNMIGLFEADENAR